MEAARAVYEMKRRIIFFLDTLDAIFMHPFGLFCDRITASSWWGEPDFKCPICGFESHVGPVRQEYTIEPCPGCESGKHSQQWRMELHHALENLQDLRGA